MTKTDQQKTAYKRKFNETKYDRIGLYVPKGGKKEIWQAAAKERGLSMSELVIKAVDEYLEKSETR